MKTKILLLILAVALLLSVTACSGESYAPDTPTSPRAERTTTPPPIDFQTPAPDSGTSIGNEKSDLPNDTNYDTPEPIREPAVSDVDSKDANLYNTKEKPAPLGQWVYFTAKNYTSGEYEPFNIRITGINRNSADVKAALASYSGIMDFSLTAEQAEEIEYALVNYEIFFAPDYSAPVSGITIPSISIKAVPIKTTSFRTEDGSAYIGVGRAYNLGINKSKDKPHPGDIVTERDAFTVLKNYDESEYVINITWYDGEISAENARELYLSAVK